jgi:tRNA threonylcarbamoyladenosine biosynthesis protein TsaB
MARGHAERLLPMAEEALAEAGLGWDGLTQLAVSIGPGTFTGVRTALATARGLALALDLPLVGITTLAAVAAAWALGISPELMAAGIETFPIALAADPAAMTAAGVGSTLAAQAT